MDGGSAAVRLPGQAPARSLRSWMQALPAGLRVNLRLLGLWLLPLAFLGLFFFYPLRSILAYSFARSETGSAAAFLQALTAPSLWRVLGFTTYQAALSTLRPEPSSSAKRVMPASPACG